MMWRRTRTLLLVLLIAALINLGIAWTIAWRLDADQMPFITQAYVTQTVQGSRWHGNFTTGPATLRCVVEYGTAAAPSDAYFNGRMSDFASKLPRSFQRETIDWCGNLYLPVPRSHYLILTAHGWPAPAFYLVEEARVRYVLRQPRDDYVIRGGLYAGSIRGPQMRTILLPYLPNWQGILVNMLVYVPLVWLALFNVSVLRQWVRYRRGRCPRCRYDLRFNFAEGCSECGWRRR